LAVARSADLVAHCRHQLESYKIPAHIDVRTSLPKSLGAKAVAIRNGEQRVRRARLAGMQQRPKKDFAMKVLISPVSYEEAASILDTGVDIIDVKNVNEGSLGAQFPWHIRKIVELTRRYGIKTSATLGDLQFKPGTAALAAYGAAITGVTYIKAGLYAVKNAEEARAVMDGVRRAVRMVSETAQVVAAGYADWRRFGGLNPDDLVRAASKAQCDVVMVDTAIKDGQNLFDNMSLDELRQFIHHAREAGLGVALAGSLTWEHSERLFELNPTLIGVRGAVCVGRNRTTAISPEKTRQFVEHFHSRTLAQRLVS
jgi:(5-formylfuran-3-yl)methyl phosphate synthase